MLGSQGLREELQELGDNRPPDALAGAVEAGHCNSHATLSELVDLYRQMKEAAPHSEDFELLWAAFNRACVAVDDPLLVVRVLQQESLTT